MSDFLTLEDLKHLKGRHRGSCLWDRLIEVASIATEKYDSNERAQQGVKVNPLKFYKRIQHNKDTYLTSYVMREDPIKTNHESLTKAEGRKNLKESVINEFSGKAESSGKAGLKRKFEEMSNQEWIKAMEMKRLNKRNRKLGSNPPQIQPILAKEFETMILNKYGGTGIRRVIRKLLQATDVSKGHSRVSIPCSDVDGFDFLHDEEMAKLRSGEAITVSVIHKPSEDGVALPLSVMSLDFAQWNVHKDKKDPLKVSFQYVLRTRWNKLVLTDELKKGDIIEIWAFHDHHDKLCLALVKI